MLALLFPGQGAQYVGMDKDLDPAVFAEADEALGFPLSRVIREGPAEELARTELTQPAIFAVSIARLRRLQARGLGEVGAAAGHSLGEYGALVAAGVLGFADAIRLLQVRARAMQEAVPAGEGAMAAVMGLEPAEVEALCEGGVEVAAWNGPGQVSVAGPTAAVDRLIDRVEERRGAAKRLAVSAPFHCAMLRPAGERLAEALATVPMAPPRFPVVQNVDAAVATDVEGIRRRLVEQVYRAVRWEGCFRALVAMGATRAVEVGPGRTLAGLGKRIDRALKIEVSDT